MSDRLIKMDYERGKIIVLRTFVQDDGTSYEKIIELDLPQPTMSEGVLRKVKRGSDGKMYETEEIIKFPIVKENNKKDNE